MSNIGQAQVNRFEIIDHSKPFYDTKGELLPGKGRTVVFWDDSKKLDLNFQDRGHTLKVFISDKKEPPVLPGDPEKCAHQISPQGRCLICGEVMGIDE